MAEFLAVCAGSNQPMAAMAASVRATSPTNNATVPMRAIGHGSAAGSSSASMWECGPDSLLINVVMASIRLNLVLSAPLNVHPTPKSHHELHAEFRRHHAGTVQVESWCRTAEQ